MILRKDATSLDMYFLFSLIGPIEREWSLSHLATEKLAQTQQLGLSCSSSGSREVSSSARDYRKEAMLSG